jgi:uncharacterized protein (DUF1501 family)
MTDPDEQRRGLSRRHFLFLGSGLSVAAFGKCGSGSPRPDDPPLSTAPPTTNATTTTSSGAPPAAAGRRLVVVQMNGGNDALNMVVPVDGLYHDARPTLAIPDDQLVALSGEATVALHPAMAPMTPLWDSGRLSLLRGIGFPGEVNRSHFVSMARWWQADDLSAPGWLGRVIDTMPDRRPLHATALNAAARVLSGDREQPVTITVPAAFTLSKSNRPLLDWLSAGTDDVELRALIRNALRNAVAATDDFAKVRAEQADDPDMPREGGATVTSGLRTAAQMLLSDVGTSIVVVSASGFDTHAGQLATHNELLGDLATGVAQFVADIDAGGIADDVLLVTTSEFGRRVAENGSNGTDHGTAGVSLLVGNAVIGGAFGEVDLADLVDGDLKPAVDPRTMFTACLDWLGQDPTAILGRRYDELPLLRT